MNRFYALRGNCSARTHRALYIPGMNAGVFRANWINTEIIMPKVTRQATGKSTGKSQIDRFRAGEIWKSPRGERHVVTRVSASGVAYMINEATQRPALRACNDLGWGADRPWIRILSGAEGNS